MRFEGMPALMRRVACTPQGHSVPTFAQWFADRAELRFLLSNLTLDTAL